MGVQGPKADDEFLRDVCFASWYNTGIEELLVLCQPPQKMKPSTMISSNIEGLRTDDEVQSFLSKHRAGKTALIKFGSSWCYHCQEVFPQFLKLTKQVMISKHGMPSMNL